MEQLESYAAYEDLEPPRTPSPSPSYEPGPPPAAVALPVPVAVGEPARARSLEPEAVYAGFRSYVMAIALNVLRNRQDAEDACQETFLSLLRHFDPDACDGRLHGYIRTIAFRKCLDAIKKRKRLSRFADRLEFELSETLRCGRGADDGREEGKPLPPAYFDVLSPREKASLALWANHDFPAADIGRMLGCSSGTVRFHLFNARRKIRARLAASPELGPSPS